MPLRPHRFHCAEADASSSLRGASWSGPMTGSATKQFSPLCKPPWIASLALAMTSVLATQSRARALPTTTPRKIRLRQKEGGGAPKGASNQFRAAPTNVAACRCPGAEARHRQVYADCALICLRGALAFRRYAAALARTFTSWRSSRPCFLGLGSGGRYPPSPVPVQWKHPTPRP